MPAALTMGLRLSHPLPTLITSCLAFPSSSDTGGHTPLLESTAHMIRVLLGHASPVGSLPLHASAASLEAGWALGHLEKLITFEMLAGMWDRLVGRA